MGEQEHGPSPEPATEKQIKFIKDLMPTRQLTPQNIANIERGLPSLSKADASKWISALIAKPRKPESTNKWLVPDEIMDGRYAVQNVDKVWMFFRVVTRNPGEPTQKRYVQKVLGAPGDFRYVRVTAAEWHFAVNTILKDPQMYMTLFGLQVGACGVCGSPLTNPESIAAGIGPVCAQKWGL